MLKLYITPGSPYARMARIVVLEKGLQGRVETILAKTRAADSPYYGVNPSGRVPYLLRDDGVGMEESALICAYLDHLDGKPAFDLPGGEQAWEARRLEALARSMVDGLSVWGREILRPENERSPGVIRHEAERAQRMAGAWEREIGHPLMRDALNMIQITLACALGLEARNPGFLWRAAHPKLSTWFDRIAARPSFTATAPPSAKVRQHGPRRHMLKTYKGSCHCGAVRFEADLDLAQSTYRCNCSICRRTRFWPAIAGAKGFRLIAGEEELTEYRFNTSKNQHFFCRRCGVRAFGVGNDTPIGKMYGVNVGCLEGVSEEELSKVPITHVDGMHDRWQDKPAFFAHL